jgi:hypothetical protein
MAQKTKIDALQKYLTKKVNTTKDVKNQVKIVDYDDDAFNKRESESNFF